MTTFSEKCDHFANSTVLNLYFKKLLIYATSICSVSLDILEVTYNTISSNIICELLSTFLILTINDLKSEKIFK